MLTYKSALRYTLMTPDKIEKKIELLTYRFLLLF